MIKLLQIAPIAVSIATPAAASEWWYVGVNGQAGQRIAYFADAEPAGGNERYPRLWVTRILETPGKRAETTVTSAFTIDRADKRVSEMQQMLQNAAGEEITSPTILPSWSLVPPDSMAATLMRFRCENWRLAGGKLTGTPTQEAARQRAFK